MEISTVFKFGCLASGIKNNESGLAPVFGGEPKLSGFFPVVPSKWLEISSAIGFPREMENCVSGNKKGPFG